MDARSRQDFDQAFLKGVNAMREHLASNYEGYKSFQKFSGPEIAHTIRAVPGPPLPVSETTPNPSVD